MSGFLGSVSGAIAGVSGTVNGALQSVSNIGGGLSSLFGGGSPGNYYGSATWAALRLPASFRGVPFVVLANNMRRGREVALHTYPFRDDPWPEDLGRSPRLTSIRGFVVGDDADAHMHALMAAVEAPGPGQLVHPVLGSFSVQVMQFQCSDAADAGRMWSFEMSVVPAVQRIYPIIALDTQSQTQGLLGSLGAALKTDFAAVTSTIKSVQASVTGVVQTVQGVVSQATGIMNDAANLAKLPASLSGNFGRFTGANISANVPTIPGITSFAQASGTINGAFQSASRIGSSLTSLANLL